jgi:Na+-driven multidrug efflux pump
MLILIIGLAGIFNFFNWGLAGIALATGIGYFVCFVVVSTFVLRHWADWNQTIAFLKDTSLPFFFSLVLILIIENFGNFFLVGNAESFFGAMSQLLLFLVLYAPCILFLEKKTRMMYDFFIPIFRKPEEKVK